MPDLFGVSTDHLLQDDIPRDEKVKINAPELLHQFEMISQLTKEDQATTKNVIIISH